MANKSQCEQCNAYRKERGLCCKKWEQIEYDDTECELFTKEKTQFKTEFLGTSLICSPKNKKKNNHQSVITVSELGVSYIHDIAKWTRFLSICSVIGMSFWALSSLVLLVKEAPLCYVGILYLIMNAFYFYPVKKAFGLASHMKNSALMTDNEELEYGLRDLRSILKYIGILTICIFVLSIVFSFILMIIIITGA